MKYWKGIEELDNTPEFMQSAFAEFMPVKESHESKDATSAPRRDFLKLMGFGVAAATLASCETPVRKAIPYLNKPEEIDPTIANYYASTYFTGADYNSVLVKSREGRPIKLEGNPESPITKGGLSARAQAAVLSLYDGGRLQHFAIKGQKAEVSQVDQEIRTKLASTTGRIAIVSPTIISPSTKKAIAEFASRYPNTTHVMYDAQSASALLQANGGVVPGYDFSKATVIVSLGADFLGTWISPVEYAKQYVVNRKVNTNKRTMSRHFQFETNMSLTGTNADVRVPVKPSEMGATALALYNAVVGGAGADPKTKLGMAAAELKAAGATGLVVSGSNDPAVQTLVTAINQSLGNAGTTIGTAASNVRQGDDARMAALVNDMNNGAVGAVIFYNANPVYNHPLGDKVKSGIAKVPLTISLNDRLDETGSLCQYAAPDNHWLESWNDFEPKAGYLSLSQPVITPIFTTRQAQESLLKWAGNNTSYYKYLRANWRGITPTDAAWDKAVHDGVLMGTALPAAQAPATPAMSPAAAASQLSGAAKPSGVELALYEKVGISAAGSEANNPFLQELPDPVSKATWGNYVAVPRKMAIEQKWEQNDVLKITANGRSIELPVLIQPGQANGTVSIALGYGRTLAGKAGDKVGENAAVLAMTNNGIQYMNVVTLAKTGATSPIAQTQTHQTLMDRRPVVQENTLAKYKENPKEVTEYEKISTPDGLEAPNKVSLWQDYQYNNHHWGMAIDLNSCIGCGSCVIGCQTENNVAVVGKQQVINRREMHWMRIDRYYSSDTHKDSFETKGKLDTYAAMEDPSENPQVIHQPMMCQQCNHAPCETVCPVLATTHSSEGLNQMTYNRCIGTRYCANNCPYKVRRFNWFSYYSNEKFEIVNGHMFTDLGRMVLNPDVTVRARGVMEKCSFCVQRIQLGKLEAKKQKRRPKDGEIVTACAQSCPTEAIVFGDMKDPNSRISQLLRREDGERAFHSLDSINVQPNVTYLTKIRNAESEFFAKENA
ncbi:TAT-variant-translocated molybdopterin oxidoreductase [Hymenobacter properus]|uniref:TAT-variant-translocated molybdopterin oxidoreductase n=1 Tax=Hymenobacter properus TaxID=2791026 RepID=A0A931FKW8_9BACT|nr:TAT-variant-translocated molybdopterin oxidoreductase [Hymenobacter properus]MBF9142170.1 TAT-variant-translocated molybdopterin oxidoreductase [Hymenobacter properus]MBR7720977.1 TAT-variant-translocated molybdopterin oxidoreductase [Microvirga sp. SRT04]